MGRTVVKSFRWLILALAVLVARPALVEEKFHAFASVGAGAINGVYYPVAAAICEIVNDHIRATGVRCSPETTPGSVYNLDALRSGELAFAIVQSDVAFDALNGTGASSGNPFRELRSVLALHPELITIVARGAIHDISDLAAKRIYVGPEGSGSRQTWDTLQQALGWSEAEAPQIVDMPADAIEGAMCAGTLDAVMLVEGHPSKRVSALMANCACTLVAVDGPAVDLLVASEPYLKKGRITGTLYGLPTDTVSFGVSAVLMTRADTDDRSVAAFASALITHVDSLRSKNPAVVNITAEDMISGSLPAALHPAAMKVYRKLGLLK